MNTDKQTIGDESLKSQLISAAKEYASISLGGVTANNPEKYKAFRNGQDDGVKIQKQKDKIVIDKLVDALKGMCDLWEEIATVLPTTINEENYKTSKQLLSSIEKQL